MKNSVHLTYINTKNLYGTMNISSVRFCNLTDRDKSLLMKIHHFSDINELKNYSFTRSDQEIIFTEHRKDVGFDFNFDWHKMFMADQVYLNGSVFEITKDYVLANPNGWPNIPEDILMLRKDLEGVCIGQPVADCPVVIAEDRKKGITTVAHSGGKMIDKKIPIAAIEALYREGSNPGDIYVHVGSCAGKEWHYVKNMPAWAKDERLWNKAITFNQKDDSYYIDLRKALALEFKFIGLDEHNTFYDKDDTISNPKYYSCSQAQIDESKYGRHFVGAIYQKTGKGRSR